MASDPIQFGGEELFAAPPERVFAVLTDLDVMAATVPDLVSSERPDPATLKCVVKPRFSFLRATLRLTISLADIVPPRSATMRIAGQGIGVSLEVSSALTIEPAESGSRLRWTARVDQMGGLMASVPSGLITGAADKIIRQGWQSVRERLGEGTAT
ncbi:MAG TPA: carbon monoxide dehydrogenase subunit G [Pirellulales bacterium]|nr:carbon monoxide dehydrogenase subunit G [Pirellulales bacterium]